MGWNFASGASSAREITREIVDLVLAGTVKPVIGKVVELRGAAGRDGGDGEPRDDRPHDRRSWSGADPPV